MKSTLWNFTNRQTGYEFSGSLFASWEVELDWITDDYLPSEVDAEELLRKWVRKISKKRPDGLIPIYWSVRSPDANQRETMPFQASDGQIEVDFLTYFSWPYSSSSGERLNWLTLPVADKLWSKKRADKGGFLQQATGWKPSILQPYVYLPAVLSLLKR